MAQNANAPTPGRDRLPDAQQPPARDSAAKPLHNTAVNRIQESSPAPQPSNAPPHRASALSLKRSWLAKLVPFAFVRFLMIFCMGVVATLAWQAYGDAARAMIVRWSPQCAWQATQDGPVVQTVSAYPDRIAPVSPDQLKAMSLALGAAQQSIDKLTTEVSKLLAIEPDTPESRAPSPAGVPVRKPLPPMPPRAPPAR